MTIILDPDVRYDHDIRLWSEQLNIHPTFTGSVGVRSQQELTDSFDRLLSDYRLAYIYGYEPESAEGVGLASRLAVLAGVLPGDTVDGHWQQLARRIESEQLLSVYFRDSEQELRAYIDASMRSYMRA